MRLLTSTLSLLLALIPMTLAQQSGIHSCVIENGLNDIPVYISDGCCAGIVTLFDKNGGALERQKAQCTDIVLESLLINSGEYCTEDLSECTIDYKDFECDDQFAKSCLDLGGRLYEADLIMECTDFTQSLKFSLLNDVRCLPNVCSDGEMLQIFKALEQNPDMGQCDITVFPKEPSAASNVGAQSTVSSSTAAVNTWPFYTTSLVAFFGIVAML